MTCAGPVAASPTALVLATCAGSSCSAACGINLGGGEGGPGDDGGPETGPGEAGGDGPTE
jgi:hypothetical protein